MHSGRFGGRAICSESNQRALSAKYARSRNYAEGLSHSSSAVVIAYQRSFVSVAICPTCRRASWRATGRLPRTSRGRPRTIGGCINVKRSRRRKEKNKVIIISTTRRCLCESKGARGRIGAKGHKSNRVDCRGSMEEKERERNAIGVTARTCLPRPAFTLHD